jgi:hypothetical protein
MSAWRWSQSGRAYRTDLKVLALLVSGTEGKFSRSIGVGVEGGTVCQYEAKDDCRELTNRHRRFRHFRGQAWRWHLGRFRPLGC